MSQALLNGYQIYHGFLSGFMSINRERQYLNKINVFPVAAGDTGNNMVRTIKMIVNGLESSHSASKVSNEMARGTTIISRHESSEKPEHRYCTEILLNNRLESADLLRRDLGPLGDSLIINEGVDKTRVHIHSNYPHEIASLLKKYGTVSEQKADDMVRQEQVVNSRKSSVAVLTDSIADIPKEILDEEQIHVINLKLSWDDDEFLDRITITPDQFYREQLIRDTFPGSSIPEPGRVHALYQYLTDYYDSVIVLPVAKSLSGTWNRMTRSAEPFNRERKRIAVIDTCLNSVAQGLLVREIARLANKGKTLESLVEAAEELKKKIRIYVSVSTFKYMVKGGRVSPLKGNGKAFDKAFTRDGLIKKIRKIITETANLRGIRSYAIVHAADYRKTGQFAEALEEATGTRPDYITSISPIVGMHSGRGALAIGVIEK